MGARLSGVAVMRHAPARCYRERRAIQRRQRAGGLAACMVAAFMCGLAGFAFVSAAVGYLDHTARLIVVDSAGDEFVAGIGDNCADAWHGAVVPADWTEIRCSEK